MNFFTDRGFRSFRFAPAAQAGHGRRDQRCCASGCAVQNIDKSIKDVDAKQRDAARPTCVKLQGRRPLAESRPSMRQMSSLWMDTAPQKVTNRSLGAPPSTALDCHKLTFNSKAPVPLTEFVRIIRISAV